MNECNWRLLSGRVKVKRKRGRVEVEVELKFVRGITVNTQGGKIRNTEVRVDLYVAFYIQFSEIKS